MTGTGKQFAEIMSQNKVQAENSPAFHKYINAVWDKVFGSPASKNLFTEKELPRGKMLLIGRSLDGRELACLVTDSNINTVYKDLDNCLRFNDGIQNKPHKPSAKEYAETSWPKNQWAELFNKPHKK